MRLYQMEPADLAEQLNCDLEKGCNAEINIAKTGKWCRFLRALRGMARLHQTKLYYVDVIVLLCYAIAVIFSCLDQSWKLLYVTLAAFAVTLILFLAEGYFLYRYKESYYDRIDQCRQSVAVIRNGMRAEIAPNELVVGDLLCLEQGTVLFSDARIVAATDLFADEKLVFGSTIPAEKTEEALQEPNLLPEKQKNMLWKGSYVSAGHGLAVVTALDDDCYVEKTGGRKGKKQRSFFYNKQNNIGHIASYIYVILVALCLLVAIIFTNHFVEAFLMMAVMTSLILLNPVSCLMEWTYYRTAAKLYKQGALIRNIEAFDGMNKEKDVYFDAEGLIGDSLTYSHTIDLHGNEKSSLSYFALCMGEGVLTDAVREPLARYELNYKKLDNSFPVFRRAKDAAGNTFSVFSNRGNSVAVAVGYWEKMLPLLHEIDESLVEQIRELEIHGKMVFLMASDSMNFIPTKLDFDYFSGRMAVTALVVFNIPIAEETLSMIGQLRRASMRVKLISDYSESLSKALAGAYDMDEVLPEPPAKPCYTLPHLKEQNLVALENASPIEKEQAMVVLSSSIAPQRLIYQVKCMFCGIRRCLNFLAINGCFLVLTVLILFLADVPMEKLVFPVLLFKAVLLCPCYYLIESVRNCNQYQRSLVLGCFCGLVGVAAALFQCDMAVFAAGFSMLLLSLYLLLSGIKHRKVRKKDVILLLCVTALCILPWIFIGGSWLTALLLALFPPIGAFLLDLFY